jgi:O-antigen/teichoic acid export membrane protein
VRQKLKQVFIRLKDPNSFINHFSYNFLANMVLIGSQIFFAPILTRFYPPESYGSFTSIFAFALNIATLLTLRYEYALLVERSKFNRDIIARLLTIFALIVSLLLLLAFALNRAWSNTFFGLEQSSYCIFSLPLLVLLQAMFQITGMEITLKKKYKDNFIYGSSSLLLSKGITLGAGKIWNGHFGGMLAGDILLRLFYILFRVLVSLKKRFHKYFLLVKGDIARGKALFKKYKQFPLYELPSGYISLLVNQSHLYFLTFLKEKALLGLLGVTFTVLDAPMRLLSYSIAPILMQKVSELNKAKKDYSVFLTRIFLAFFLITTIPFLVCTFWATDIFTFVFGSKWAKLGVYVSSFLIFYFFRIEVDIHENLLAVTGFNKNKFIINLFSGFLRVTTLLVLFWITKDAERSIILWGFASAIIYFFLSLYYSWLLNIRSIIIVLIKIAVLAMGLYTFVLSNK